MEQQDIYLTTSLHLYISIYLYRNHDARANTPTVFNTHTLSISLIYIILTYIQYIQYIPYITML